MAANRANIGWYLTNQIGGEDDRFTGRVYDKEIKLTTAQVKAMNGTPVALVAAPGIGKVIEFISAVLFLDHDGGGDYANGGNIIIRTRGGTPITLSQIVTSAAGVNISNDGYSIMLAVNTPVLLAADVNKGIELYCNADHITGTSPMTVKVTYRIHDFN